jgi:hypothetical protein
LKISTNSLMVSIGMSRACALPLKRYSEHSILL